MENIMACIDETADYIRKEIDYIPDAAIILGSGLGPLAGEVTDPVIMKYGDIPHFKVSTVSGHAGELTAGVISGRKVLIMNGRFHYYEGHAMDVVTFPVRVFSRLGISKLIVTNAAGGIKDTLMPGSIMLINDHIGFMCPSPLNGPNLDSFGPRFQDMTDVYTPYLRELARKTAYENGIAIDEGVYCYFKGPQYETPAEIRAARLLGADAAGMSTVPEVIVARHCGMDILGISLITNKAAGLSDSLLSHSDVTKTAQKAEKNMVTLIKNIIREL